jgi:hypothetical protein
MDLRKNQEVAEADSCWFIEKVPSAWNQVEVREQEAGREIKQLVPTLFIFHRGKAYPVLERLVKNWPPHALGSIISRINSFHQGRMNPRSFQYMKELVASRFGRIGTAYVSDFSIFPQLGEFEQIILLWPDGNGMGWFNIERQILNVKNTSVFVLNGRKRLFELRRTLWRKYRVRRFLEKSFLLEIGILILFLITAPVLSLWDLLSDKRKA